MTKPDYQTGCQAGSKVRGIEASAGNAWLVNLDNGNADYNHQSNHNCALAGRPSECQRVTFRHLHAARRRARRGKTPSFDQLAFEARWLDGQFELERSLNDHTWRPGAPTCFIAHGEKAREIHAPPFVDRVAHWAIVPPLEADWEPVFIHDSYANRLGKGTHAAVDQVHRYVRQVASGQGGGFYLQIDIANFFNSIRRETLYRMLRARMRRKDMPQWLQRAVHALLTWPIARTGVVMACSESERAAVPAYKRLENAAAGCGIAMGNYTSQFFANVFLNALDQFAKHTLKIRRYVRYVDDIIIVHHDREQLERWRQQIEAFLRDELHLTLKAEQRLQPLSSGIDFLGYVIFPTHRLVRRRVVSHCRAALAAWERRHVCSGLIHADRPALEQLRSTWASYAGHFRHAKSFRIRQRLVARFPWLPQALHQLEASC